MNGAAQLRNAARNFLADDRVATAVRLATFRKVEQRAAGMALLRDAEALRELAAQIRRHVVAELPRYLEQFIDQARRCGAQVHVARTAADAQRIIVGIAEKRGVRRVVKSKSMATEEVHLNAALEAAGVQVVETDLGEFIVQLDRDRPSHIVTPIIHKDRRQIAQTMVRELGCAYSEDPAELTAIARDHLRQRFREADLGVSGVNFGIAESGGVCLCTNEGNGRMTVSLPRVHVALMGIERLVPRLADLGVFLKLLARSSTGQPLTVYTTLLHGPRRAADADGPQELHVVLLDNGRAAIRRTDYAEILNCIRCGACLNACPAYRNMGGHAYDSTYPGPIGAVLTPLLARMGGAELARASSLCGACQDACPVKIDIPRMLLRLRAETAGEQPILKRAGMRLFAWMMADERRYGAQNWMRRVLARRDGAPLGETTFLRRWGGPLAGWLSQRDLAIPSESFRERWQRSLAGDGAASE